MTLQAEELANSVEQQRELVAVTRETLEHEREMLGLSQEKRKAALQPDFQIRLYPWDRLGPKYKHRLKIMNSGGAVSDFQAVLTSPDERKLEVTTQYLKPGDNVTCQNNELSDPFEEGSVLTLTYFDKDKDPFEKVFSVHTTSESDNLAYELKET